MRPNVLLSTCLLVALLINSFADSKHIDLSKPEEAGLQKHSKLSRLGGTPVDKAESGATTLGSDGHHETGQNSKQGDTTGQPAVANPYGAGTGANAYGTQNVYNGGAAYGSNTPLYGNPNGAQLAPNNYLYNGAAYGVNPCSCSQGKVQPAHGVGYQQNAFQGPKLQRNQDAISGQGYQYNQGYSGMPPYAQYPPYNVQYPLSPVYPAPPVGYAYPQNYLYPYNYNYWPQHRYYHHHHLQQQQKRNSQHEKKHRVKKQKGDKHRDKMVKSRRTGKEGFRG